MSDEVNSAALARQFSTSHPLQLFLQRHLAHEKVCASPSLSLSVPLTPGQVVFIVSRRHCPLAQEKLLCHVFWQVDDAESEEADRSEGTTQPSTLHPSCFISLTGIIVRQHGDRWMCIGRVLDGPSGTALAEAMQTDTATDSDGHRANRQLLR